MDQVRLYSFRYNIEGHAYGGHIPALSLEEAETRVREFGATIDGVAVAEIDARTCAVCSGHSLLTTDVSNPEPLSDEWDEEFD